ncbi:hypothetical protein L2E82_32367 [Cichorium intybus]|uniref:Uncharacterized protein n=1 Tax=Cichorium intybus TaxID=13427 RepID=A0ACB9BHD3_CICIN|nr:hypothetical protein L2E82_32367 [Cichorium intybus]
MESALNGITICGTTLAVNVARYQRGGMQRQQEERHVGKERKENDNGPVVNLVSLGCFGPFPSLGQSNVVGDGLRKKRLEKRRLKRRRADSGGKCCSPISDLVFPISEQVENLEDEFEATVRIGTELGFQITWEDVARLQESEVGGDGNVDQ